MWDATERGHWHTAAKGTAGRWHRGDCLTFIAQRLGRQMLIPWENPDHWEALWIIPLADTAANHTVLGWIRGVMCYSSFVYREESMSRAQPRIRPAAHPNASLLIILSKDEQEIIPQQI